MISTLGEVHDLGWRLRVYCRFGKREGMKSIRACTAYIDIDVPTLIWTRGRDFPIARLILLCHKAETAAGASLQPSSEGVGEVSADRGDRAGDVTFGSQRGSRGVDNLWVGEVP